MGQTLALSLGTCRSPPTKTRDCTMSFSGNTKHKKRTVVLECGPGRARGEGVTVAGSRTLWGNPANRPFLDPPKNAAKPRCRYNGRAQWAQQWSRAMGRGSQYGFLTCVQCVFPCWCAAEKAINGICPVLSAVEYGVRQKGMVSIPASLSGI